MKMKTAGSQTIDEYIAAFPEEVQVHLNEVRAAIRAAAPEAIEKISYQMPTYYLKGNLVHFAAHQRHIGFYPAPSGIEAFKEDVAAYHFAKGSVQFPFSQPLPLELIRKIVQFRVGENLRNAQNKSRK
jgi:uncharacterized protein YdhG (YjbR/CyaY superfamily)